MALALFAALIGPYFIDWTTYRADFEREASRVLGQKVEVLGDADARIIPFPSVTFSDVRVSNADSGETMMDIENFSMDLELAPFLSGEILIFDMRVDGPEATVTLRENGTLDWALRHSDQLPGEAVELENVTVTNGAIRIIDAQNGREHRVSRLDASLSARTLAGPWKIDGTGTFNGFGAAYSIQSGLPDDDGVIRLRSRIQADDEPILVELEGDARFVDFKPRYNGLFTLQVLSPANDNNLASNTAPNVLARTTGAFELTNERLRIPEYRLEAGATEDPYIVEGEATIDTGAEPDFLLIADGQQFDVDGLSSEPVEGQGRQDRPKSLTLEGRLDAVNQLIARIPIPPMDGRASIVLPAIIAGDTTIREIGIDVKPDGDGWRVDRFVAKFPGRTQVEASGRARFGENADFIGDLVIASNQPTGLASWLTGKVDPAIRRLSAAGIASTVNLSSKIQRYENLEIAVGSALLEGRIERVNDGALRPSLSMELAGNAVDLDSIRALAGLVGGGDESAGILDHDIAAKVKTDVFTGFGLTAEKLDAGLIFEEGQLSIDRLSIGSLEGVEVSATGLVSDPNSRNPSALRGSVSAADVAPMLEYVSNLFDQHPVAVHLLENAGRFTSAQMDFDLNLDQTNGFRLSAAGQAGGSSLVALFESPSAVFGADMPYSLELTGSNSEVHQLLGQTGIDTLPFGVDGEGLIALRVDRTFAGDPRFSVAFSAPGTDVQLTGEGEVPRNGPPIGQVQLDAKFADFEPYLIMLGRSLPGFGSGLPLSLTSEVLADPQTLKLTQLQGVVAGNVVAADLLMDRTEIDPIFTGQLSLDEISLPWLAELILGPGAQGDGTLAWSKEDFSPPIEAPFGLDVAMSSKRAFLGFDLPADRMEGRLQYNSGDVRLTDVSADWMGGNLTGNLSLGNSSASGVLSSRLFLTDADPSLFAWSSAGASTLEGEMNLSLAFEGSGSSLDGLANSISGSGVATLSDTRINGLNSDGFQMILDGADVEDFKIEVDPVAGLAFSAAVGGSIELGDVTVPFSLAAGTARISNILVGDENARLTGDARISLPASRLEAEFELEYEAGEDALTGAEPIVVLGFDGALSAPSLTLDVNRLVNYLSLRAFERERRQVELLQAAVLEKQRMRRELALLREADAERARLEEEQRLAEEEARRRAEEEAAAANGNAENAPEQ